VIPEEKLYKDVRDDFWGHERGGTAFLSQSKAGGEGGRRDRVRDSAGRKGERKGGWLLSWFRKKGKKNWLP